MMTREMKRTTVVNSLRNKVVVKTGEIWMHGTYGVVTINSIDRMDNKKCTTAVHFTTMLGEEYIATARDFGAGLWAVACNFLFKVKSC